MEQEKLLLVDDQPENIGVLYQFLEQYEYELLVATNGEDALEIAHSNPPNLILLDIMMPGMNGIECCQKLKAHQHTCAIPVIFMSALTETEYKVEGFAVGGVDYITKPFQQEEVLARVQSHLTIANLQNALKAQNAQLDAFAHTVAHDLKNTMHEIAGGLTMLEISALPETFTPDMREGMEISRNAAFKASSIIEALLLLAGTSRHQVLNLDVIYMEYLMPSIQERLRLMLKETQVQLCISNRWPRVYGYLPWVEEIWVNYISNAAKYGGTPPRIELGADIPPEGATHTRFWVQDNGTGLTPEEQQKLFIPFSRLHRDRASGHGLGLSIVQNIVERLGGEAGVESQPGQGCRFFFTLPCYTAANEMAI